MKKADILKAMEAGEPLVVDLAADSSYGRGPEKRRVVRVIREVAKGEEAPDPRPQHYPVRRVFAASDRARVAGWIVETVAPPGDAFKVYCSGCEGHHMFVRSVHLVGTARDLVAKAQAFAQRTKEVHQETARWQDVIDLAFEVRAYSHQLGLGAWTSITGNPDIHSRVSIEPRSYVDTNPHAILVDALEGRCDQFEGLVTPAHFGTLSRDLKRVLEDAPADEVVFQPTTPARLRAYIENGYAVKHVKITDPVAAERVLRALLAVVGRGKN